MTFVNTRRVRGRTRAREARNRSPVRPKAPVIGPQKRSGTGTAKCHSAIPTRVDEQHSRHPRSMSNSQRQRNQGRSCFSISAHPPRIVARYPAGLREHRGRAGVRDARFWFGGLVPAGRRACEASVRASSRGFVSVVLARVRHERERPGAGLRRTRVRAYYRLRAGWSGRTARARRRPGRIADRQSDSVASGFCSAGDPGRHHAPA